MRVTGDDSDVPSSPGFGDRQAVRRAGAVVVGLNVVHYVARAFRSDGAWWYGADLDRWVGHWVQYDGHRYIQIVNEGYSYDPTQQSTVAWFPGYPAIMWTLSRSGGGVAFWGVVVTIVSTLGFAVVLRRWLAAIGLTEVAATTAWGVVLLSPFAWYLYGPVYPDALYLVLVAGAFLLVERGSLWPAAAVVALATATRPTAVALLVGVVVIQLERDGVVARDRWRPDAGALRRRQAIPAVGAVGVLGYVVYLWVRFDAPLASFDNQATFRDGHRVAPVTQALRRMVDAWIEASVALQLLGVAALGALGGVAIVIGRRWGPTRATVAVVGGAVGLLAVARWRDMVEHPLLWSASGVQALMCLAVATSIPAVNRRLGVGYAAYTTTLVALVVVTTPNFIGAGRYLLAALPTAVVVGGWLTSRPPARRSAPVVGAVCMVAMSFGFVQGWYLS